VKDQYDANKIFWNFRQNQQDRNTRTARANPVWPELETTQQGASSPFFSMLRDVENLLYHKVEHSVVVVLDLRCSCCQWLPNKEACEALADDVKRALARWDDRGFLTVQVDLSAMY
jgi:hypothetical protein